MNNRTVTKRVAGLVKELIQREATITEETRIAREILAKDTDSLRNLVRDGKATSGDRITDYFIAAHWILDDVEVSKPLREMQERMVGKKGELFLVVQRESKRHVFRGPSSGSSSSDYHLETRYALGVLSEDEIILDLKRRTYGLTAERHFCLSARLQVTENAGPFLFVGYGFQSLGDTVCAGPFSGEALEVIIGDDAVLGYFPDRALSVVGFLAKYWVVMLNKIARTLGKDVPEAPEEVAAREKARRIFLIELNEVHNMLVARASDSAKARKKLDDRGRNELSGHVSSKARELGLEADLLVRLVLKEIREASP